MLLQTCRQRKADSAIRCEHRLIQLTSAHLGAGRK
jgi:hypothetical protein